MISWGHVPSRDGDAHEGAGEPSRWYVVRTRQHREALACAQLGKHGLTTYTPRIEVWPRPIVGTVINLMFPSYVFVRASLPRQFYDIQWTPGVTSLVGTGGRPGTVDDIVIDYLRAREDADGVVRYGDREIVGHEVRITNGVFRGLSAVFERRLPARERVRVLMQILNRETRVELPERWIARS